MNKCIIRLRDVESSADTVSYKNSVHCPEILHDIWKEKFKEKQILPCLCPRETSMYIVNSCPPST